MQNFAGLLGNVQELGSETWTRQSIWSIN